jgi:XTP/dITP diphosphohydrolase
MRVAHQIVFASTNHHKLQEFNSLLALYPDHPEARFVSAETLLRNPEKLGFAEVYPTYLENAAAKARLCNQASHYPALADDSGLEVFALDGRPGVRSARYAKLPPGVLQSPLNQDRANVEQVLRDLAASSHPGERKARFVCTLALVMEGLMLHASAALEGTLLETPRGTHGFGYDPIFVPEGSDRTLAEMTTEEKNALSHRRKALDQLMLQIRARGIVFAKP